MRPRLDVGAVRSKLEPRAAAREHAHRRPFGRSLGEPGAGRERQRKGHGPRGRGSVGKEPPVGHTSPGSSDQFQNGAAMTVQHERGRAARDELQPAPVLDADELAIDPGAHLDGAAVGCRVDRRLQSRGEARRASSGAAAVARCGGPGSRGEGGADEEQGEPAAQLDLRVPRERAGKARWWRWA